MVISISGAPPSYIAWAYFTHQPPPPSVELDARQHAGRFELLSTVFFQRQSLLKRKSTPIFC
jgi:hypothetical protein